MLNPSPKSPKRAALRAVFKARLYLETILSQALQLRSQSDAASGGANSRVPPTASTPGLHIGTEAFQLADRPYATLGMGSCWIS